MADREFEKLLMQIEALAREGISHGGIATTSQAAWSIAISVKRIADALDRWIPTKP